MWDRNAYLKSVLYNGQHDQRVIHRLLRRKLRHLPILEATLGLWMGVPALPAAPLPSPTTPTYWVRRIPGNHSAQLVLMKLTLEDTVAEICASIPSFTPFTSPPTSFGAQLLNKTNHALHTFIYCTQCDVWVLLSCPLYRARASF